MPTVNLSVNGVERLVRLAAAIKAAGDQNLQKELRKTIRDAGKPLRAAVRQGELAILPHRGGLDEYAARSKVTTNLRTSGSSAGLQVVGNVKRLDEGFVRHPTFGHRGKGEWKDERVVPGCFTKPLILEAQKVRPQLERAMYELAQQLERDGG